MSCNLTSVYNQLFRKGDRITVIFDNADPDTGVFIRVNDNFLKYVSDDDNQLKIVSLATIVVNKE